MDNNPVTSRELAAALDRLILEEEKINLSKDDLTIASLQKRTGWAPGRIRRTIAEWEKIGKIEFIGERREPVRGSMVKAWRVKVV